MNEYGKEIRKLEDVVDYLKAAIAVEKDNVRKMKLENILEACKGDFEDFKTAMDKRKAKIDRLGKKKNGNA